MSHCIHTHIHIVRPDFCEMTVFGAAIAAGTAVGVWEDTSLLPEPATKQFQPALTSDGEDIAFCIVDPSIVDGWINRLMID